MCGAEPACLQGQISFHFHFNRGELTATPGSPGGPGSPGNPTGPSKGEERNVSGGN